MPSTEARVNGPVVPVDPAAAIAAEVTARARERQVMADLGHVRCYACLQSIFRIQDGTVFSLTDLEGCLLAHLMQAHGWTRETAGA